MALAAFCILSDKGLFPVDDPSYPWNIRLRLAFVDHVLYNDLRSHNMDSRLHISTTGPESSDSPAFYQPDNKHRLRSVRSNLETLSKG
ncbi:hypothetical protein AC579_9155 [Pseudocercospora musae]|uniref:Uncharacterized protein n=1 Tax=Pseudocercospora musae TaxID=113226 RepID=A0A139I6N0_9PEZI|nr:hypothetical protein AC579_9155 [Pseudocercospora musae]